MKLYWLIITAFGLFSASLYADDTEIYLGTADRVNPNVIFIFDTSGSMAYSVDGTTEDRLEIVQRAAADTIRNVSGINLALMRYNPARSYLNADSDMQYRGGFLSTPMLSVDNDGVKDALIDVVNSYNANGGTPMTEAVHEAVNFLRGNPVDYGMNVTRGDCIARDRRGGCTEYAKEYSLLSNTLTVSGSGADARYISPITDQCQKNHIVLFTDGDSSVDGESNEQIRDWLATIPAADRPSGLSTSCKSNGGGNMVISDSCIEELAFYMYHTDSSNLEGKQRVNFHAIGGFLEGDSQSFLDNAARVGGGISAAADNYDELKAALTKIFDDISQSAGTFAAPAVAVNAFNSLEQLDQMYYSVFKPHENIGWSGNVKRFRMSEDGEIVDAKGNPAVDTTTGFFSKNAQSYWTLSADAPDGDNVVKGGIASRLVTNRKVVSNIVGNDLNSNSNRIFAGNPNLISQSQSLLGTNLTGTELTKLVQWLSGLDVKGPDPAAARRTMEDPLHSRPVLVNYGSIFDAAGNKIPDSTLYIGTNSGYLHAFDTSENNPLERFAFIPKELLPVASAYYAGGGTKRYGLDGPITVWHQDTNRDQIVNNDEKAYLYVGMRRGGSSYYALDISNRNNPSLLWQINGRDHANTTPGFDKLGQTWSRMMLADVKWIDGKARKVLIFGGGYDHQKEDNENNIRTAHDVGNAVYMVDASSGELLWKASAETNANLRLSSMTSGIVGNVVTVDDDSDGLVELLYFADLGGRIWRIDFSKEATTKAQFAQGGVIADLGSSTTTNNVRFYNTLDVVYSKYDKVHREKDGQTYEVANVPRYQLSIGSGYRAHPLNDDARDNFFVIFDYNTEGAPESYSKITKADLANFNNYATASADRKNNGFYIPLYDAVNGEKVLSDATTLENTIYFTSYRPVDPNSRSGCEADTGRSRLYIIKPDPREGRVLETKNLKQPGIAPNPVIIQPPRKPGQNDTPPPFLQIGTETIPTNKPGYPLQKTYWREQEQ